MFVWAKLPGGRTDSMAFCEELMEKAGVVVTPGASFGPSGEGHVRMALVLPPVQIALAVEVFARQACIKDSFSRVNRSKPISCSYFTNSANNFGKRSIFDCE